ncbi:L-aspartate oxidase [Martelella alba]|uniref:L-aspartate oxidase n=1 Tax=Martelella alba TaxID=2590451 RepID=A0A506U2H0_9HYPH|nr:L-aspartate oxidase [Martelella alba]TPW28563.1 L-aspartate oxidase [Martelella alba]
MNTPVIIIGSGIAGLVAALELAPLPVTLITRAGAGEKSSSALAQGGIAAAMAPDDAPALQLEDTLRAGDGLCDPVAAAVILNQAPAAIQRLERHGVIFDRNDDGTYALALEAAHCRRRVLHAGGDGSGAAIVAALASRVLSTPSITLMPDTSVRRLIVREGRIEGVLAERSGRFFTLSSDRVLLATGGIGGLYATSTNPPGNFGQGVMLAARAGAHLADMEFVQFHPTGLAVDARPVPLISEAVRGEGAVLINDHGERFMAAAKGAELAPRDVVARAIFAEISRGNKVFLDARACLGTGFYARFPAITAICREAGIDPARDLIPVAPAQHYHMGGIDVDEHARTSVPGLWAAGECAATGLHGANRLASNSLTEAVVTGARAAADIAAAGAATPNRAIATARFSQALPEARSTTGRIRPIMSRHLGVLRSADGLHQAIPELLAHYDADGADADPALVALAVAVFADLREETRGGHARTDFPQKRTSAIRNRMDLDAILDHARNLIPLARSA